MIINFLSLCATFSNHYFFVGFRHFAHFDRQDDQNPPECDVTPQTDRRVV